MMAVLFTIVELVRYARVRATFPTGLRIAGIPVGGLTYETASERLVQLYLSPIELTYDGARIQVRPATLGFELRVENMLAIADQQRTSESCWIGFWKYLWNQPISGQDIPLDAKFDDERIRSYLENDLAPRYDVPSTPPMPIPGESSFSAGQTGFMIDYKKSIERIKETLGSGTNRTAVLEILRTRPTKPGIGMLDMMLKSIIEASPFDGMLELYLKDLQSGMVLHFTYSKEFGQDIPVNIAFSSWSTIKIPVLISLFKNLAEPYDPQILAEIEKMVELSDNASTDAVTRTVINQNLGPLEVTQDIQALGIKNTFWAGYFTLGSPLLQAFTTPANERTDYVTDPDRYGQTTPEDLGLLLEEIYYCARDGGGAIPLAFNGEVTQAECQMMVQYLGLNRIGVLIQAGVPAGVTVAHKHGWANEEQDGLVHTMGDAGIVYSAGGDYVLSIYAYHPVQILFDQTNLLFANLSSAAYNYFNLE